MASIDRCSVLVSCCCCRITERSTVALERSSTSTVPSADCLIDAAVDSSANAVRHSATAMADEQPRKMFFSLSSCVSSLKLSGASHDTGSTNEVIFYDEDEELRTEEQMDRSRRDGRPEESSRADRLQTVDLMDRSDVHGRPSERQNDGFLRDDQTVDQVDRSDIHGRPSERQNDVSLRDDQTVDRDVEDGRPSPRQKVSDPEPLQTVDPVDRFKDGGRPSSSQQTVENLGRGQREKRPNVRLADYVTHVAGSHVGEKCKYPLASYVTHEKFSDRHKCFLSALDAGVEPTTAWRTMSYPNGPYMACNNGTPTTRVLFMEDNEKVVRDQSRPPFLAKLAHRARATMTADFVTMSEARKG
ncbi:unnamed protein product [Cuscuta campestris]|uniref:Uncharacterized protein n=1 Tax=Cuscuta campestris TaxID=132261 RepID=A0A484N0X9_9ASTE|nr:unnamed protein product [Cuscuta campestris]